MQTTKELKKLIKTALFTPTYDGHIGLPLLFQGAPGTTKTAVIAEVAAECGLHLEVVIASIREPSEFSGLPVPSKGQLHHMSAPWARRAAEAGDALVFLDELNTAPPAVQAALLRVVNERVSGDQALPRGVRFIAAQNAVGESAGGYDLSAPMANRFGHLDWAPPSVQDWGGWLLSHASGQDASRPRGDARAIETDATRTFSRELATAAGLVTAFLHSRPQNLHRIPKAEDPNHSRAWPSHRSWTHATYALAGAAAQGLDPANTDELFASFVGQGVAGEFLTFMRDADLPNPEDLLDGKVKFKHDVRRPDRTIAALSAAASVLANPAGPDRQARAVNMAKIMFPLASDGADLLFHPFKLIVKAVDGRFTAIPEMQKVLAAVAPMLDAAGVMDTGA